jgi:hypothetical protein
MTMHEPLTRLAAIAQYMLLTLFIHIASFTICKLGPLDINKGEEVRYNQALPISNESHAGTEKDSTLEQ